jgi:hypothetical protein
LSKNTIVEELRAAAEAPGAFLSIPSHQVSAPAAASRPVEGVSMRTCASLSLVDLAAALRQFAERVERLPMASHRSPEEPFIARQELAREMRRMADTAMAGQGAAKAQTSVRSIERRRKAGTHRIVVAGRIVMVQHRRAAFAL